MVVPIKPVELMQGEFNDFIGVWENHMPPAVCNKIIKYFDDIMGDSDLSSKVDIMNGVDQFSAKNLGRKDTSFLVNYHDSYLTAEINQYLQACLLSYIKEYGQLENSPIVSSDIKMQKTSPSGGYHVWHYENSHWNFAQREMVWSLYLNTVDEGGETEWLYQNRRISPKQGTVVIWPAGYTHVHRGNPPLSGDKYILTGWYIRIPQG